MTRLSRRQMLLIALAALVLLGLAGFSPSYTRVIIKQDGQEVDVQKAGFGPQGVKVKSGDVKVESFAW
jgi:hypothetical protein